MKPQRFVSIAALATLLAWSVGWAQQAPGSESSPDTSAKEAKGAPKEKHWTGDLVDAGCVAKALSSGSAVSGPSSAMPHFVGMGGNSLLAGQSPGGAGPGSAPGPGQPEPGMAPGSGSIPSPDMGQDQRARDAQVERLNNAEKQCAANASTQSLALVTSDGELMRFDADGTAKAREALKDAGAPEPGKKVKAKVTGTVENNHTVKVASVDVKTGKAKRSS